MFTFTDNNSGHSGGPAAEDEIVRDTGRAMGQILAAARAFILSRANRGSKKGLPKLSRQERKDLAEAIRVQVGEQKIAAAWYTKRVNDYHAEVVAAGLRRQQPGFTEQDAALDRERLAGIRYSIESTLHEQQSLPLERRGQVALALSEADRNPSQPYGAIFKTMDARQARVARQVAVLSEGWVAERREHNARLVAEQREQAAKLAEARRELRPPRGYDELDQRQRNAVQRLRSAHLGVDRAGRALDPEVAETAREATERAALSAGLTRREIAHEIDYMAEHTSYTATYGMPGGGQVTNHYPVREEALSETVREMSWDARLPRDASVFVEVEARADGLAASDVERRSVMAPRHEAVNTVARWSREPETEYAIAEPHEVAVARIEPGTGKVLASEMSTVGSETAALDYAHDSVNSASSDTARMRVEITDPQQPGHPRYESYGLPKTLTANLADQRVLTRERLLDKAEFDRMSLAQEHASLRQRHSLSIEHNANLTDHNADLTRQLATMIAERDQALAEAKTMRGERDEAVSKLVETTRPSERYGSAERQAAASRGNKQMDEIVGLIARAGALDGALARIGVSEETRGRVKQAVIEHDRRVDAGQAAPVVVKQERAEQAERSPATEHESAVPEFSSVDATSGVASGSGNALADALERQAEREGMDR
ncbi:hypothetical protein ACFVAV_04935 [Nocardia sp. NPDC057663]|uniref:hypothetical protein n=1 Tax=Nocardia sp. NPDC057663 TaxID=3346201 RepID=UPI00366DF54D